MQQHRKGALAVTISNTPSGLRCEGGRYEDRACRNKVVIQAPSRWRAGEMMNLCQRHADEEAHRIIMENHRLYWALAWQGNITNA